MNFLCRSIHSILQYDNNGEKKRYPVNCILLIFSRKSFVLALQHASIQYFFVIHQVNVASVSYAFMLP